MEEMYNILKLWGKDTVNQMIKKIRETENYSGHMRGRTRLESKFNPKLIADSEKVMWYLDLPGYAESVDKGIEPGGNKPNELEIFSWAINRNLPEEGISRKTFVYTTRNLVALRGVKGSDFFSEFDTRVVSLEKDLYNIGERMIDKKLSELENKYK